MDENKAEAPQAASETEQQNIGTKAAKKSGGKQPRKQNSLLRQLPAGILTLLLIMAALLVFVYRDAFSSDNLRQLFARENSVTPARDAFTYETGAEQVFAPAGDGLAVACSSSVQLLDDKGQTVYKQVVSFDLPAVFACSEQALFCDLGGTDCIVADMEGGSKNLGGNREILSASMNDSGWFSLVTAEPGYKGLVSVYSADCEKRFEWWSGAGYVLRAVVSPDNRNLAVLSAEKEGSYLRFFALNSEKVQAELLLENLLFYDLYYLNDNTLCMIGDSGLYYVSTDGTVKHEYLFNGSYLLDYEFNQNFIAVFLSNYHSGAGGKLLTLDQKASVLGVQALDRDVISLSAVGKQLLVMTGGGLVLYDQALVRQYANETLMTALRAILRPAGDILLLSAYSAERFSF